MTGVAITDDSAGAFVTGKRTAATGTATQISSTSRKLTRGVDIRPKLGNTGTIYVGNASTTTAGTADDTDGYELAAGEAHHFEIDDLSKLWIIASAASQEFFWKAV